MSIISLIEQMERDEIILPAIQRDFVWSQEKIEKLMDSIMRGYPIGIVFLNPKVGKKELRISDSDFDVSKYSKID